MRRAKLREWWVNVYEDGSAVIHGTLRSAVTNRSPHGKTIHVREVPTPRAPARRKAKR